MPHRRSPLRPGLPLRCHRSPLRRCRLRLEEEEEGRHLPHRLPSHSRVAHPEPASSRLPLQGSHSSGPESYLDLNDCKEVEEERSHPPPPHSQAAGRRPPRSRGCSAWSRGRPAHSCGRPAGSRGCSARSRPLPDSRSFGPLKQNSMQVKY